MAEKGFGVKEINLIGASGTPTIESPNNLNLNAVNVAISTNATIGGNLTVSGTVGIAGTLTYEDVTNVDAVGIITARDGIKIPDDKHLRFGTDNDTSIIHSGTNTTMNVNGNYFFQGNTFYVQNQAGTKNYIRVYPLTDGRVEIYNDNNKKFETSSSGVTVTGTLTATTFSGSGASLTNLPAANLTGTLPAISGANLTGITTSSPVINFVITANSSSAYRFAGGGVDASEDNPDLFLEKGVKYRFDNTTGNSHPFAFRVSNGGSAYTDGITGSQNGVQFFTVPFDAPDILAYQCTIHGGMVGNIYTHAKTTQCYDIYRLAANYTIPSASTTLTQSMVRPTLFFEKIGPGMSVSSGVFTFPSTGKYEIQAFFQGFQSGGSDNIFKFNMDATSNNSTYQEVVNCREGNYDSGRAFSASFTYLIDITNTSTHKVRFGTTTAGSNLVQLDGNSASNILDGTYFVFKKILNT